MTRKKETPLDDFVNRRDSHTSIVYTIDPEESISHNVIRAVATATEVSPEQLEPLYNVVDPDALDRLFKKPFETLPSSQETIVSFHYEGYLVTVQNSQQIILYSRAAGNP